MGLLTIDLLPDGGEELAGAFTAANYYDGQFTALYALASTGSLELYAGEGLQRIGNELKQAILCANMNGDIDDAYSMGYLLSWVKNEMKGA
jgi:hypothetical protein